MTSGVVCTPEMRLCHRTVRHLKTVPGSSVKRLVVFSPLMMSVRLQEASSQQHTHEKNMKVNNATYSEFFEFVVPGVLLNGVGLLGFCGNILSIIVLSRPQMKSSINCILIGNRILHIHILLHI